MNQYCINFISPEIFTDRNETPYISLSFGNSKCRTEEGGRCERILSAKDPLLLSWRAMINSLNAKEPAASTTLIRCMARSSWRTKACNYEARTYKSRFCLPLSLHSLSLKWFFVWANMVKQLWLPDPDKCRLDFFLTHFCVPPPSKDTKFYWDIFIFVFSALCKNLSIARNYQTICGW